MVTISLEMISFHTTRRFLNELVDDSFLAYVKSLESRRRCEDGSVQDLSAIRCFSSLSEHHQIEQDLERRLRMFEEQADKFLRTKETSCLPSQLRFYEEISRFRRALAGLRESFLGVTPKPDVLFALSLPCNTKGWQDSFSLLHANRVLDSLLYHFRNSLLSLLLSCGEEHASLLPEHSAERRARAESDLSSSVSKNTWKPLSGDLTFCLSLNLSASEIELIENSFQVVQLKLPLLHEKLKAGSVKIFIVQEKEPALIESDFTSTLGGVLSHQNNSREMYIALNDWSTEPYCSLTDLSQRHDGALILGSHLAQTLGYLAFLHYEPCLPQEVESYPPLQSLCHALRYFVREGALSADQFTRALAEYRPTYEALYILYAAEEVSPVPKQWTSNLPSILRNFAKSILGKEHFGESWAKTLLYSSSGL